MCLYLKYFKCTGWHAFSPPAGWITQLHDSMSQIGFDDIVTEVDAWLADGSPASSSRTELGETLVAGPAEGELGETPAAESSSPNTTPSAQQPAASLTREEELEQKLEDSKKKDADKHAQ